MTVKLNELTKKSKWKLIKEVPFYPRVPSQWYYDDIKKVDGTLPIGSEFTVPDKRQTIQAFENRQVDKVTKEWTYDWFKEGVYFDVTRNGQDGIIFFTDINDSIELLEQPKDLAWYIRDKNNGEFYFGVDHWSQAPKNKTGIKMQIIPEYMAVWDPDNGWQPKQHVDTVMLLLSKTVGSAKKFKNIGLAKNKILSDMGYFNDSESMMRTGYALKDIPTNWEIVEHDKVTGISTAVDFDIEEYVKHAFELKGLTTKYGSATRELYKKLEKKDQIKDYKYFLIFTAGDVTVKDYKEYLNHDNELLEVLEMKTMDVGLTFTIIDSEIDSVKKLDHKGIKKCFNADSMCFGVKDKYEAMELSFTYYGKLDYIIVDMETLQQVVQEK